MSEPENTDDVLRNVVFNVGASMIDDAFRAITDHMEQVHEWRFYIHWEDGGLVCYHPFVASYDDQAVANVGNRFLGETLTAAVSLAFLSLTTDGKTWACCAPGDKELGHGN